MQDPGNAGWSLGNRTQSQEVGPTSACAVLRSTLGPRGCGLATPQSLTGPWQPESPAPPCGAGRSWRPQSYTDKRTGGRVSEAVSAQSGLPLHSVIPALEASGPEEILKS